MYEFENNLDLNVDDASIDSDNDGLTNAQELANETDPNNSDTDYDGLSDGSEVNEHLTHPLSKDSDNDRMTDGFEVQYGLQPLTDDDAALDPDEDGFTNVEEYFLNTDPTDGESLPVVTSWHGYQANNSNTGFVPVEIAVSDIELRWQVAATPDNTQVVAGTGGCVCRQFTMVRQRLVK